MKPTIYFIITFFLFTPLLINAQTGLIDSLNTDTLNVNTENLVPSFSDQKTEFIDKLDSLRLLKKIPKNVNLPRKEFYSESSFEGTIDAEVGIRYLILPDYLRSKYEFYTPVYYAGIAGGLGGFNLELIASYANGESSQAIQNSYAFFEKGALVYFEFLDFAISYRFWKEKKITFTSRLIFNSGYTEIYPQIRRGTVLEERIPSNVHFAENLNAIGLGGTVDFKLLKKSSQFQVLLRTKYNLKKLTKQKGFMQEFAIGMGLRFVFRE